MTALLPRLVASIAQVAVALIAILGLTGSPDIASAEPNGAGGSQTGQLTIWVPAAVIGDRYWVYLNGRIISAPPHHTPDVHASGVTSIKTQNGWEFWNEHGLILKSVQDAGWERDHSPYALTSASRDALQLFRPLTLKLRAGAYGVDLATISNPPESTFPFVFTGKWDVTVEPGHIKQLYLQVPQHFVHQVVAYRPASPYRLCNGGASPPTRADLKSLEQTVDAYNADPIVEALRTADASVGRQNHGAVVINFPAERGGSHEFDGVQINAIVDTISTHLNLPNQSDVTACRGRYPQFSHAYAAYSGLIAGIDDDVQSLRDLAVKLRH